MGNARYVAARDEMLRRSRLPRPDWMPIDRWFGWTQAPLLQCWEALAREHATPVPLPITADHRRVSVQPAPEPEPLPPPVIEEPERIIAKMPAPPPPAARRLPREAGERYTLADRRLRLRERLGIGEYEDEQRADHTRPVRRSVAG
jgi:hypothetical protein